MDASDILSEEVWPSTEYENWDTAFDTWYDGRSPLGTQEYRNGFYEEKFVAVTKLMRLLTKALEAAEPGQPVV